MNCDVGLELPCELAGLSGRNEVDVESVVPQLVGERNQHAFGSTPSQCVEYMGDTGPRRVHFRPHRSTTILSTSEANASSDIPAHS